MKSLDKLRSMELYAYDEDERGRGVYKQVDTDYIADKIEDEIYDNFLPIPRYQDGEPMDFGETVVVDAGKPKWRVTMIVDSITYNDGRYITLRGVDKLNGKTMEAEIEWGERLLKPR